MNLNQPYYSINWTDGMKLNKDTFIASDFAGTQYATQLIQSSLSPIRYGLLPGGDFDCSISVDNQNTLRVNINSIKAITFGGYPIAINNKDMASTDGNPATSFTLNNGSSSTVYWVVVVVVPSEKTPFGTIDPNESPARLPFVTTKNVVQLIEDHQISQYLQHPLALVIGKVYANGSSIKIDDEYLPPCLSVSASQDMLGLQSELDSFLSSLELSCSIIVQKIFKRSQQNELSDLALYLCDRTMLYLSQTITTFRWHVVHEPPSVMLAHIVGLARVLKNMIDLRIGSGKDELMNYLCEWCELKQGELETLLTKMADMRYNHNDVNQNIDLIIQFSKTIGKLFTTLSNLEFIGKRKDSGLFVKEEMTAENMPTSSDAPKPKRRFFG